MKLTCIAERWSMRAASAIAGHVFDDVDVVFVLIEDGALFGRGEAYGVYYRGETVPSMIKEIESVGAAIEAGLSRDGLRTILGPGGARAALDAALWELDSQRAAEPVWRLAGLDRAEPVVTTRTLWAGSPKAMEAEARRHADAPWLKLKLLGDGVDAERVRAVRAGAPGALLCVDANQGLDPGTYAALLPALVAAEVRLIEQPFPVGQDEELRDLDRPIPIAADESAQASADLPALRGLYDWVNIKLDKCGGLTEGLEMQDVARGMGLRTMVGCMTATSLAMAPAFVLAQRADLADVDGPLYLTTDRPVSARYQDSRLTCPAALWGAEALPWHRQDGR